MTPYSHYVLEMSLGVFGTTMGILMIRLAERYRGSQNLYWLTMWGLTCGPMSILHAHLSTIVAIPATSIIPWTYLPERLADCLFAALACWPFKILKGKFLYIKRAHWIIISVWVLWLSCVVCGIMGVPAIIKDSLVGRPQELAPLMAACMTMGILFVAHKPWGRMLYWSTCFTAIGSLAMLFSHDLYDLGFSIAHMMKPGSYFFIAITCVYAWYSEFEAQSMFRGRKIV